LDERVPVVEVEAALGGVVHAGRDEDVEVKLPERRRRVGTIHAHGDNRAAADVDGDGGVVDVRERHVLSFPSDGLVGDEVVELVVGEIEGDVRDVFVGHGADEEILPVEELKVDGEGVRVLRVEEPQGVE